MNVSTEQHAIHKNHVVEHTTVVSHVSVGEKRIVVTDPGCVVFFFRSTVNRHALSKNVVVPDDDTRWRFDVGVILRFTANNCVRVESVVRADGGVPG